jgi:hypothetical protein
MGERLSDAVWWLYSSAGVTLVGTLLILAVTGAVVVYLLGEWRDRRQRGRELKGLLRILDMEIAGNECFLRLLDEHPAWVTQAPAHSLQSKAWEDIRMNLAHLLENYECFEAIANYYENLQEVERYHLPVAGLGSSGEVGQQRLRQQLRLLLESSDKTRGGIRKHF